MERALLRLIVAVFGTGYAAATPAWADEQLTPLAISGNWVAMAHRPNMTAPADVCVAFNQISRIALRADSESVELRVTDESWSLPAGVHGNVTITVGPWSTALEIGGNTEDTITAAIEPQAVKSLFVAMDKASAMSVAVGKAKPIQVSLAGSTKVTDAFRTCAGIRGSSGASGSNPFN